MEERRLTLERYTAVPISRLKFWFKHDIYWNYWLMVWLLLKLIEWQLSESDILVVIRNCCCVFCCLICPEVWVLGFITIKAFRYRTNTCRLLFPSRTLVSLIYWLLCETSLRITEHVVVESCMMCLDNSAFLSWIIVCRKYIGPRDPLPLLMLCLLL